MFCHIVDAQRRSEFSRGRDWEEERKRRQVNNVIADDAGSFNQQLGVEDDLSTGRSQCTEKKLLVELET